MRYGISETGSAVGGSIHRNIEFSIEVGGISFAPVSSVSFNVNVPRIVSPLLN